MNLLQFVLSPLFTAQLHSARSRAFLWLTFQINEHWKMNEQKGLVGG